ncbi:OLC1v1023820C1 [Oldenlandia corymbosa var. corymbosa]|uniref:OLC1v1023820C1 n=1 Tax=Oldenlandia corymbosa var. corymbosa TaxID=529605 RepID=A0AAV1C2I4_OLDCO|nr:OLC1v1023820C1 [Oldenlandia corymbosa var. corymbosa]
MKLHFKRGKQEGLHPAPFYLTTTTTPASATSTAAQSMCSSSSPSHSEPQASSQIHSPDPNPQNDSHSPPQDLVPPIDPAIQPDPDKQNPILDHINDCEQDPEDEADGDREDPDQDPDNPGDTLSDFPDPPCSIDTLVDPNAGMVSTRAQPSLKRSLSKRKKGKVNVKKLQAIEKKLQTLLDNLKPVPFVPSRVSEFSKHERLLKWLGLWDFCHIEFDRSLRVDLIAKLIANYDPKGRCSYVNDLRINVNRSDLGRALRLPVKKEKGVDLVDLEFETLSDESIGFIESFVSNWILLHEDTWMMPNEVLNWTKAIKDGHPGKVDWPGLIWFMVEKELMKGERLVDCYYASHFQCLIKSQRAELMLTKPEELVLEDTGDLEIDGVVLKEEQERVDLDAEEEVVMEEKESKEKLDAEATEDKGSDVNMDDMSQVQGNDVFGGPNVELTLGPDVGEKEGGKDAATMDLEEDVAEGQWRVDGKNNFGQHFLQPCGAGHAGRFDSFEERKEEVDELEGEDDEEEEAEEGFDVGPGDDTVGGEGLTGNFLQGMEADHIVFSQGHLHGDSSIDLVDSRNELQHLASEGMSFYNANGKREVDHEHDIFQRSLDSSNKRLRTDGPMDFKSLDFGTCMGQMQQMMVRARMLYEEKEQNLEQLNMHNQLLLNELEKRDSVIAQLQRSKSEEIQKRDAEMYRLQRELFLMRTLLDDYRNALKQTNKAFTDYRQKRQLPEESIYKDVGPGGVVLSTSEIEKQRLKEEEDYKVNCTILEQKAEEAMEGYEFQLKEYVDKIYWVRNKLAGLEDAVKELRELRLKPKVLEDQQPNVSEDLQPEVSGDQQPKVSEDHQPEVSEDQQPIGSDDHQPKVSEDHQPKVSEDHQPKVSEDQQQVVDTIGTSECPSSG